MPTFKIWNAEGDVRKTVQADSVAELCVKGGEKLGLKGPLKIVLKTDGTEIEDDSILLDPYGLCSEVGVVLILLQAGECWSEKLTKQQLENFPCKSSSGTERLLSFISQHSAKLRGFIDPDFGLLNELLGKGLLSEEQYAEIQKCKTYFKKNDSIIRFMKEKTKEEELQGFLDALRNTDQNHVVNYILANGEHLEMYCGRERPLNTEEVNRINANFPFLLQSVIVNEELLAHMLSSKCITREHQEHVKAQCPQMKRIEELRTILVRRSASALQKFVNALDGTHQKAAASVLSQAGVAVPVHVDVSSNRPTRDLMAIEEELAEKFTEFAKAVYDKTETMEKKSKHYEKIKDLWLELELYGIRYLSSKRGKSVAVYLWCRSRSSMTHLCRMRESGDLGFLLEETMQLLVEEDNAEKLSFSLKVIDQEWNLAKDYFKASESHTEIAKSLPLHPAKYETNQGDRVSRDHFGILPKEIVEMILMRSLLSAVCIPWKQSFSLMPRMTVLKISSVRHQWHELLSQRTWFASTLKSYMKRNSHIALLQEHSSVFYECLDVDFYFLYEMLGHGLLSEEQLLEIGSESDRRKQIELFYTEVLLKFNSDNYKKFLKVLQSTGQSHISGCIQAKGANSPKENDVRPLTNNERSRINAARLHLTDFIPSHEFLTALGSCDCITKIQVITINCLPDDLKISELLEIIGRRSYTALRQFAAHLRKMDQYADVAQILTTDAESSENKICDQKAVDKSGQKYDLEEIECDFADKLIKIGRFIESGGTITIQDLNEIRSYWMLLERLQADQDLAEVKIVIGILDDRRVRDSSGFLETDYIGQVVWPQYEQSDVFVSYDQSTASYVKSQDTHSNQNQAKLKESHSYTSRTPIYQEFLQYVLKLMKDVLLQVQKEQYENKLPGLKAGSARYIISETRGTSGFICQRNIGLWLPEVQRLVSGLKIRLLGSG